MPRPTRFSDEIGKVLLASIYYDFAEDGGTAAAHELPGQLPSGAIVLGGTVDVITTFTTAGADAGTIALHIQSAGDIVAAVAVSNGGNPWDAGNHDIIPDNTGSTGIKLTADRQVSLTAAGQAITAGKLALHLLYVMSPNLTIDG